MPSFISDTYIETISEYFATFFELYSSFDKNAYLRGLEREIKSNLLKFKSGAEASKYLEELRTKVTKAHNQANDKIPTFEKFEEEFQPFIKSYRKQMHEDGGTADEWYATRKQLFVASKNKVISLFDNLRFITDEETKNIKYLPQIYVQGLVSQHIEIIIELLYAYVKKEDLNIERKEIVTIFHSIFVQRNNKEYSRDRMMNIQRKRLSETKMKEINDFLLDLVHIHAGEIDDDKDEGYYS